MSKEQESSLELKLQESDMSVTPNEIRNAEFATTMRGFNRNEVAEFMEKAATALEDALTETAELHVQQEQLQKKYEKLVSMEDSLKSTLLEAQRTADTIRANAEHDIRLALERARGKQALIEKQAQEQIALLQDKVCELDKIRLDYQEKIQLTITSHLKLVEDINFSSETPTFSEVNESTDIERVELEQTEIEEVTLFEPTIAKVEKAEESEDITTNSAQLITDSQPELESQESDSLHSALTDLTDESTEQASPTEAPSTSEAIAQAIEKKSSADEASDETLYKKLATEEAEADSPSIVNPTQAVEQPQEPSENLSKPKTRQPIESGADGIVVFGRKEDREKAVEENARILSELDSVVDKFAEELRELDNK